MLTNYLKISARSIWRNRLFSAINILGLAIGISASLVIYLIVSYDLGFDKFHKDSERIYRIYSSFMFTGEKFENSGVTLPLGDAVREEVTGLECVVPMFTSPGMTIKIPSNAGKAPVVYKKQDNAVYTDSAYFSLITYTWLAGSPKSALNEPFRVVLTESRAKQYFPNLQPADVVGQNIIINDSVNVAVSGIVKDLEEVTDFRFKTFFSRATMQAPGMRDDNLNQWGNTNSASQLLIKLNSGTKPEQVRRSVMQVLKAHHKQDPDDKSTTELKLQPLSDIHFNTDLDNFDQRRAHKPTLYGLLVVATFLLILGCINFINLSTANASKRAKEIGIRKTLGSSRPQLVGQFLNETLIITVIATALSVVLTPYLLKLFSDFIPEGVTFNLFSDPRVILFLILLVVVVTLIAGSYPAFVLSGFSPVKVLKNQGQVTGSNTRSALLRKSLTVVQFVIAQIFIIGTLMVGRQINYSLNKDLGFNKEGIVFFNDSYLDTTQVRRNHLADIIRSMPDVTNLTISNGPPLSGSTWTSTVTFEHEGKKRESQVQIKLGDTNYLPMYKIRLLAGRNLEQSDTSKEFLINETYARQLGFDDPSKIINLRLSYGGSAFPIVGVMKDFHQKSVHQKINPLLLTAGTRRAHVFQVALRPGQQTDWKKTVQKIETAFKQLYPELDFEYQYFDDSIAQFYTSEKNTSTLLNWASGLAIFISCLGLLGLVVYITSQRTKEIGIRKVVGASAAQIMLLLSKDFVKLVLLAFLIAIPIAWWGVHKWLENYEYRATISWTIFLAGGFILLALALLTLSVQVIRTAMSNPVNSLRNE